jgi:hypothetical protein
MSQSFTVHGPGILLNKPVKKGHTVTYLPASHGKSMRIHLIDGFPLRTSPPKLAINLYLVGPPKYIVLFDAF